MFALEWRPSLAANSVVLDEIYQLSQPCEGDAELRERERGDGPNVHNEDAEYALGLAYGVLVVRALITGAVGERLARDGTRRAVVVGFDSGDFVSIGVRSLAGFEARPEW